MGNLDWKKVGLIIGFIIVTIALGFTLYYLFFRSEPVTPIVEPEEIEIGQLGTGLPAQQPSTIPTAGVAEETVLPPGADISTIPAPETFESADTVASGGITKVTDLSFTKTTSISLATNGSNIRSYDPDSGKFYETTPSGQRVSLTDRIYKSVEKVNWASNKDEVILEFPDGSNILYNFESDKQVSLPKDWAEFSFNNNSDKIGFKDLNNNPDYRFLAIANPDGSEQQYIEPLGSKPNDFKVDWSPNEKIVAQYKTGKSAEFSKLFFVGKNGENFKAVTVNGYGLETKWTPDGSKLLYSAHNIYSSNKPLLHIVDASGENIGYNHQSLKLNTWADKCSFAGTKTVYCAVPKELPAGANYVPELADNIADYIYKVDLQTGSKSFVAEPEFGYTIDQITVSEDGENLYFTDKFSENLHLIKLK